MAAFVQSAITFNTTAGSKNVVITPAVNGLIVVIVADTGVSIIGETLTDDRGGTYSQISGPNKNVGSDACSVWVRNQLATSAVAHTITHNGSTFTTTGGGIVAIEVSGMTQTGLAAVLQNASEQDLTGAIPAPAFAAAVKTGNMTIGFVFNAANPAAMTPPTSWLERQDTGYATPTTGIEVVTRDSGFTGTTVTWGSSSASNFCDMVIELDTSAAVIPPARVPQLPVYPTTAPQPQMSDAWIAEVVRLTRTGPIPVDPQPLPVYPRPADQPRHVEASWMRGVIDATRDVLPAFEVPPLPMRTMIPAQPLSNATAPASSQPVVSLFVPPPPWPQPNAVVPRTAPQPIPLASWLSVVPSDFFFTPWPQPPVRAGFASSDRARAIAAWAQLFEGGFPLMRWPLVTPLPTATAVQPLQGAAYIADQGQPVIITSLPHSWPPPLPPFPGASSDRARAIAAWVQLFEGGFPLMRWPLVTPLPTTTAVQPLQDAAHIADQGQPLQVAIVLRPWPQLLPTPLSVSPDRAELLAAVAQTLEGGVVLAQRIPIVPPPPWIAAQPLFDAAMIADKGQPPTILIPRVWPQPLPKTPFVGQRSTILFAPLSTGGVAFFVVTATALAGFVVSDRPSASFAMTEAVAAAFLNALLTLANFALSDAPSATLKNSEES